MFNVGGEAIVGAPLIDYIMLQGETIPNNSIVDLGDLLYCTGSYCWIKRTFTKANDL